jgi:peroxiredoxin
MLKEGTTAPAFTTKDSNGTTVKLKDFRGGKEVLYLQTTFALLADVDHSISNAYGVYGQTKIHGPHLLGSKQDNLSH